MQPWIVYALDFRRMNLETDNTEQEDSKLCWDSTDLENWRAYELFHAVPHAIFIFVLLLVIRLQP